MASWLSRGHTTWLSLSRMLQLNLKQPGHCTTLASPTPFFRSFAAVGRPRKAAAAPKAAKAAAATATEKKPASAYALYVKQAFPKTKSSNPSAPFADISKQVSAQWKGLDQSQKSEYENAYLAAKAEWDRKYPNGAPATPKRGKAAAAATATAAAPKAKKEKKAPTTYALFVKQKFGDYKKEGASAPDTMRVLAGAWKGLSEAEKAKFKSST